ncbi:hypothetical protein ACFX5Q_07350 [Mesorhizobium sp. IMUNJ 23033]|uniref:hypothetical protein n=1 Tax=Mesorhizobium sp. IMUNJ 23033 TaxID=3378039 RepID=UPI00384A4986
MPNTTVRAAGEAMPAANLNRRLALLGGLSAATALAAIPRAHAAPMTARERFDFHLAEMQKAATEIDPLVRFEIKEHLEQPDWPLALMIIGQWATGRYEGDGVYAGGGKCFSTHRYNVKLLDTKVGVERGFSVIKVGEKDRRRWMTLSESSFEAFIGARVS